MIPKGAAIRDQSTKYGLFTIGIGVILLIGLRVWTSPIARRITGRSEITIIEFLLIPLFLVVVGTGVLLFLWEPEPG